jgi:hypothetical protein
MSTVHKMTPKSGAGRTGQAPTSESLHSRIQERAYRLFLERGGQHGRDLQDWLEAERQVRAEVAAEPGGAHGRPGRERPRVMGRRPSSQI